MISVQRVPKTRSIIVIGIPDDMKDELIRLYFESTKRSGGDDIVDFSRKEACVIITFKNCEGIMLTPLFFCFFYMHLNFVGVHIQFLGQCLFLVRV